MEYRPGSSHREISTSVASLDKGDNLLYCVGKRIVASLGKWKELRLLFPEA